MLAPIDNLLGRLTMYRVALYSLGGMLLWAIVLSLFGSIPYSPADIVANTLIASGIAFTVNLAFVWILDAPSSLESSLITAFILALIFPLGFPGDTLILALVAALAVASKYLVAVDKQHIFNPAAAAAAAMVLLSPNHAATWWIGTPLMLPAVIIGGLLIVRKIRREAVVLTFLGVYVLIIAIDSLVVSPALGDLVTTLRFSIVRSAVLFFAFVMLTEPATMPATKRFQYVYATVVALLYATPQFRAFGIVLTPEVSLCLGNIVSYVVRPKYRFALAIRRKQKLAPNIWSFEFANPQNLTFVPGQYMEWILPHDKTDSRGDRRYFSLASSPSERHLMVLTRVPGGASSFKRALFGIDGREAVVATRLAGDFVLPKDMKKPLAFIAAGVGIAPFRSMARHIVEHKISCNIVLVYANRTPEEILFRDFFAEARRFGLRTVYVLTDSKSAPNNWQGQVGRIDDKMIRSVVSHYERRTFYLAGPQRMVQSVEASLRSMRIGRRQILTDYFPGYAEG